MQDDEADVVFRADLPDMAAGEGFDLRRHRGIGVADVAPLEPRPADGETFARGCALLAMHIVGGHGGGGGHGLALRKGSGRA
jgi:hypothetical protein